MPVWRTVRLTVTLEEEEQTGQTFWPAFWWRRSHRRRKEAKPSPLHAGSGWEQEPAFACWFCLYVLHMQVNTHTCLCLPLTSSLGMSLGREERNRAADNNLLQHAAAMPAWVVPLTSMK